MPNVSRGQWLVLCFYTCVGPVGVVSLTVQSPAGAQGVYSISWNPFKEFPCCFTSHSRVSNPLKAPMGLIKCILVFRVHTVYATLYADRRFMDFLEIIRFLAKNWVRRLTPHSRLYTKSSYSWLTLHGSWIRQVHNMCLWPNTQWLNQSASNDPSCRRVMWWPAREATLHLKNSNCSSWRGLCRCCCYVRTAEWRDGYWNLVLDWPQG